MTETIHFSVGEIARSVQGRVEGDEALFVEGAAGLEEATDRDITFFHNPKYKDNLARTRAAAIIVPENTNGEFVPHGRTLIKVSNPQWAFAQVLAIFDRNRVHHPQGVDPRAVVHPTAQVGRGTVIYPGCYIGENCRIGENCLIYPNAVLREETQVGSRVIIHAGAVLGADGYGFVSREGRHHKIPQIGNVVVEDDVEIGANVTIDRATTGQTRIGAGTKIDNLVHIAHNVQIGKNCLIVAQVGISGSTRIGSNVTLAGQVGIVGHLTVGDGAIIAAQSGIMNDVAPGEILFGSPARPHREAMKLEALFGKLPELYETLQKLKKKVFPD